MYKCGSATRWIAGERGNLLVVASLLRGEQASEAKRAGGRAAQRSELTEQDDGELLQLPSLTRAGEQGHAAKAICGWSLLRRCRRRRRGSRRWVVGAMTG
jgi:hypothetical protein